MTGSPDSTEGRTEWDITNQTEGGRRSINTAFGKQCHTGAAN